MKALKSPALSRSVTKPCFMRIISLPVPHCHHISFNRFFFSRLDDGFEWTSSSNGCLIVFAYRMQVLFTRRKISISIFGEVDCLLGIFFRCFRHACGNIFRFVLQQARGVFVNPFLRFPVRTIWWMQEIFYCSYSCR